MFLFRKDNPLLLGSSMTVENITHFEESGSLEERIVAFAKENNLGDDFHCLLFDVEMRGYKHCESLVQKTVLRWGSSKVRNGFVDCVGPSINRPVQLQVCMALNRVYSSPLEESRADCYLAMKNVVDSWEDYVYRLDYPYNEHLEDMPETIKGLEKILEREKGK